LPISTISSLAVGTLATLYNPRTLTSFKLNSVLLISQPSATVSSLRTSFPSHFLSIAGSVVSFVKTNYPNDVPNIVLIFVICIFY